MGGLRSLNRFWALIFVILVLVLGLFFVGSGGDFDDKEEVLEEVSAPNNAGDIIDENVAGDTLESELLEDVIDEGLEVEDLDLDPGDMSVF